MIMPKIMFFFIFIFNIYKIYTIPTRIMILNHLLIYCLKLVTLLYTKNVVETHGVLTMHDLGIAMGTNVILFYVITVLSDMTDSVDLNNNYFVDLISTMILVGIYVKYLETKNERELEKAVSAQEQAHMEVSTYNKEHFQTIPILPKPVLHSVEYINMKLMYGLCLSPYYVLF